MKHEIVVAQMSGGNVQRISRHHVATATGLARLSGSYRQIWLTRETARALDLTENQIDTLNVQFKSPHVLATA